MNKTKPTAAEVERARIRALVVEHAPLVKLLREMYPSSTPPINATDREIGQYIGQQKLVEGLEHLLAESLRGTQPGELPSILQGR